MRVLLIAAEIALAYLALALYIGVLAGALRRRDARLGAAVAVAALILVNIAVGLAAGQRGRQQRAPPGPTFTSRSASRSSAW